MASNQPAGKAAKYHSNQNWRIARPCVECNGDKGGRVSDRCEPCQKAHKKAQQKRYIEEAAKRHAAWVADAPAREERARAAAEETRRRWEQEAKERAAAEQQALLRSRSAAGSAARKALVDADPLTPRRGPPGTHSWAITRVKELDSGELLPIEYRCRDCGTIKTVSFINRPTYTFPEGHDRHFPEGLPMAHIAGPCPYGAPARDRRVDNWRDFSAESDRLMRLSR